MMRYDKDRSPNVLQFIAEVLALCDTYGLCLAHEDEHGSFIVRPYSKVYADWFRDAAEEGEDRD